MSDQTPAEGPDAVTQSEPDREPSAEPTGHQVVDELLGRLEGVEDIPVDERLPIFEAAHEALRDALSGAADQPA